MKKETFEKAEEALVTCLKLSGQADKIRAITELLKAFDTTCRCECCPVYNCRSITPPGKIVDNDLKKDAQ